MKKILALLAVIAFAVVPSMASDTPDGADCAGSAGPASVSHAVLSGGDPTTSELDRGAVCVSDGSADNGSEVYIGGEIQAEEEGNPDFGGACGAIIVGGTAIAGDADWDNAEAGTHCD